MGKCYKFNEPHITGGNAVITITEEQILTYMRKKINYEDATEKYKDATDEQLIDEFCIVNWAWWDSG